MHAPGDLMRIAIVVSGVLALGAGPVVAEPTETEIANVTAEVAELRTNGGVTRQVPADVPRSGQARHLTRR